LKFCNPIGIEVKLIDVRTLHPFDLNGVILESLKKTNRILFLDEDFPGGTTAYLMQKVLEEQGGFHWLDSTPKTLSATEHRPAYGSDGDYFSKPNREQVLKPFMRLCTRQIQSAFPNKCKGNSLPPVPKKPSHVPSRTS
jgi:pyruvate/2-oxoglutarate/acetoin dehydrogenase E1 component